MRVPLEPRYNDYDTKGHVNNAVYLTYFEMARVRAWLDVVGGEPDAPFILAEATVRFRKPAHLGVPLGVEIATTEIRTRAWVWQYRVFDQRDDSTVAEGSTVQVMFDYGKGEPVAIPDAVRERLGRV